MLKHLWDQEAIKALKNYIEMIYGTLREDYKPVVEGPKLRDRLNSREKLSIEEYLDRRSEIY